MCGIVGYVGNKQVVPLILDGLRKLEYRGYDSAGIAVVNEDTSLKYTGGRKTSHLEYPARPLDGTKGLAHQLGHTRPANEENAHPHRDCTRRGSWFTMGS